MASDLFRSCHLSAMLNHLAESTDAWDYIWCGGQLGSDIAANRRNKGSTSQTIFTPNPGGDTLYFSQKLLHGPDVVNCIEVHLDHTMSTEDPLKVLVFGLGSCVIRRQSQVIHNTRS
jgi:hypothetical protein